MSQERISQPIHKVKLVKNVFIPARDGVRLAADLYMPEAPGRYPAILHYVPYRKDDRISGVLLKLAHYFTRRGYVVVGADIRGTGLSEGSTKYMMGIKEWQDGYDIVEWIATQDWCDGNVGMTGESYGGYSCYLVAAQEPPHLRAIVPLYVNEDLFGEQFPGGNLLAVGIHLDWAARMVCMNYAPPTQVDAEGRWKKIWDYHLQNNEPWPLRLLEDQTHTTMWKESALCFQYDKVKAATFIIGGWHDCAGPSAPFTIYQNIKAPKKVLIGPYLHTSPDVGVPGPRIDHLYESLRWFDYWMKGIDTGITREPPVAIFVQEYDPPAPSREVSSGEWRNESDYPMNRTKETPYYLHPDGVLSHTPPSSSNEEEADTYVSDATVGTMGGIFDPGYGVGLPLDQRMDDALSLTYTTEPLTEKVEVTGFPRCILFASSSVDVVCFTAKLCDVAPDGVSNLVTRGVLNATRRESVDNPKPIVPGKVYELTIEFQATSYAFRKGHRIRLSIANADFPYIWPTPKKALSSIYRSVVRPSRIVLPIIPEQDPPLPKPEFRPPSPIPPVEWERKLLDLSIRRDVLASSVTVRQGYDEIRRVDEKTSFRYEYAIEATSYASKPEEAHGKNEIIATVTNPAGVAKIYGKYRFQSSVDAFHVFIGVDIKFNDTPYFSKSWIKAIPRNLL